MRTLRLASFGMRGSVGDALSPETVIDVSAAFGTFLDGGPVLVCRDSRASSPMCHAAVVAGLISTGCDVLDFGVCPTPIAQFSVERYGATGAIAISGGHTKLGYNAVTLIGANGSYLDPVGGEAVLDMFHARDFKKAPWDGVGACHEVGDFSDGYFTALEESVAVSAIRDARLKVVIDPVNGAGCRYVDRFARGLGLHLMPVNEHESTYFAHDPEPRPRNAMQAASLVRHAGGHIGFVSSSDMGRISIVSETGETASEEYTLALVAKHVLQQRCGPVATNVCSSRMVDDVAAAADVQVVKTKVGQAHVMSALADEDGVVGGEGSGGVAVPSFSRAFDGFVMMAQILEALVKIGGSASELLRALPRYHITKRHIDVEPRRGYRALENVQHAGLWDGARGIDSTDGVRVDWEDGWVHVRASRTEPLVRIISEARSETTAAERAEDTVELIEQAL